MSTVWIKWKEQKHELSHRRYVGNGDDVPVFTEKTVIVNCRYSNDTTPEMIERAHRYVETDRPDAWVVVE